MNTLSLFDEPCTWSVGCCMTCVPPTSGVEAVTPAMSCPTAKGSLPVGIVSRRSRLMTDCPPDPRTSTSGDSPDTVTDSCSAPTDISALIVAVNEVGRLISSRFTDAESGEREGDGVDSRPQILDLVAAGIVRDRGTDAFDERGARRLDADPRQHRAGAVAHDTGGSKIENLRPGVYAVTFTLTGFRWVKRDDQPAHLVHRDDQRRDVGRRAAGIGDGPLCWRFVQLRIVPPKATNIPVTIRNLRLYFTSKYSGTVISFNSRKRLMTKPVRPTKIMTKPEMAAAAKEAKPYL